MDAIQPPEASPIETVDQVIAAVGKPAIKAAQRLGSSPSRLSKWKERGIPRTAWPDIVRESDGKVTYEMLEKIEAARSAA